MKIADLINKRIAIIGYGVEGQSTARFLNKRGIVFDVLDRANQAEFSRKNSDIKFIKGELVLGEKYLDRLADYDLVFKSPGIPNSNPKIKKAIENKVEITTQTKYFFANTKSKTIGVTGTKGKGTTSSLIYQILKKGDKEVFIGGNIGTPVFDFFDQVKSDSWVVLELSSYQLQDLDKSPNVAVVLNVTADHLDYHKDVKEYREAKKTIVKYQNGNDLAIINYDYENSRKFATHAPGKVFFFSRYQKVLGCYVDEKDQIVIDDGGKKPINITEAKNLQLRGRHNLENVTAAIMVGYLTGVKANDIREAVENFQGLEHRLEFVAERGGIKYYNDSFSTVPETAIAAIDSFDEDIILICGGSDKGADYHLLGEKIADSRVKAVILIGDMAGKIEKAIPSNYQGEKYLGLTKMEKIVEKAKALANDGDIVLLSPACASFGLFSDYKDRGNQFKKAIYGLPG